MRASRHGDQVTLRLSRRNLTALLAKLDGHPPNSACTIIGGSDAMGITVIAEEDEDHYPGRLAPWPGIVHADSLPEGSENTMKLCWDGPCYSHPAHEWTEKSAVGETTYFCPGASTDRT